MGILHLSLKDTPYQANRVLALLSKMLSLADIRGWRSDNPVKGMKRFHEERRDRWLSDEELRRLTIALQEHPNQRAANRLQLLTGARLGEVLTARRDAFDLERGVWRKHHTRRSGSGRNTCHSAAMPPHWSQVSATAPRPSHHFCSPATSRTAPYAISRSSG